jgi:hypothetical protein
VDLSAALRHHDISGTEGSLQGLLFKAAEKAINMGGPCGGNEVDLAHLADFMAHLVLALSGFGNDLSSISRGSGCSDEGRNKETSQSR